MATFEEAMTPAFRGWIYRVANERVPYDNVDDAAQEAMVAVWRKLAEQPDASRALLAVVVKRSVASFCRGERRTAGTGRQGVVDAHKHAHLYAENADVEMPDPTAQLAFEMCEKAEITDIVGKAMSHLSDRDRAIVRARFWDEHTWEEVAAMFGFCSWQAARCHWYRMRTTMKAAIVC